MPLTDEDSDVAVLRRNLSALLQALRTLPVSLVQVRYEGGRGRCRLCEVSLLPSHSGLMLATPVAWQRRPADAGGGQASTVEERVNVEEGLKRFTLHWTSLQHGHWQRGDGGQGVMRLQVASGVATLDHDALHIEQFHATLRE
ncbi:MAG TPA: hypothetical protein VF050_00315 [Moraxellaceae bacterium]